MNMKHETNMGEQRVFVEKQCTECQEQFVTQWPDQCVCEICEEDIQNELDFEIDENLLAEMPEADSFESDHEASEQMNAGPEDYDINGYPLDIISVETFDVDRYAC